jgi:hypothetical protein
MGGHPELFGRSPDLPVMSVDATADEIMDHYDLCRRARIIFSVVTDEASGSNDAVRMFRNRQSL